MPLPDLIILDFISIDRQIYNYGNPYIYNFKNVPIIGDFTTSEVRLLIYSPSLSASL